MRNNNYLVSEVFGSVTQGEGAVAGRRSMFVRLAGCDGASGNGTHCLFCDSMYAVDPKYKNEWHRMNTAQILAELRRLADYCKFVTISGGNPALYDLTYLLNSLHYYGYETAIETQGTVFKDWFSLADIITFSPKPPSSGYVCDEDKFSVVAKRTYTLPATKTVLKVVVDPDNYEDVEFALRMAQRYETLMPIYLLCLTRPDDTRDSLLARYQNLEEMILGDTRFPDVHLQLQFHALVHGANKRGI